MFEENRQTLVKDYTIMLAAILTGVMILLYIFLAGSVYFQQKELVQVFAYEESEEWHSAIKYRMPDMPGVNEDEDDKTGEKDDLFYYAYDVTGKRLGINNAPASLVEHIERAIAGQDFFDGEVRLQVFFRQGYNTPAAYMMTKKEIVDGGVKLGELYAGKDVLPFVLFLFKTGLFFVFLAVVLLLLSLYIGRRMADKAMVPIQQGFERQKDFAANASHELRTPLSVITAAVETIERNKNNVLTEFSQSVLADLKEEIRYMSKITEDLLTLARLDKDNWLVEKDRVDVRSLLQRVVQVFQPAAQEKSIVLEILLKSEFAVWGNENQLLQVVRILTDNAIKYTEPGNRVSLTAVLATDNRIRICVEDTGCGLEPAVSRQIFERFYRVDKARSRSSGGTGLGLAIARELVQANHGTIEVESALGRGSRFSIILPQYTVRRAESDDE